MINLTEEHQSQPLVTVVIPTYNRPGYLEEAIRSALAQTYQNLEILVRDNGTDAATSALMLAWEDARIHYQRHPQNIGMTNNVLGGFRNAKGKYVTNLHDDDHWEPEFISEMVAALEENPAASIAFCDHFIIDAAGEVQLSLTDKNSALFGRRKLAPGLHQPFMDLALVQMAVPMAMAAVVRKDAIDWADFPNLTCAYDFWLVYLACRDGLACYYLAERLTSYRIHAASESNLARVRLNKGFIEIYRGMLLDARVASFHAVFLQRLVVHYNEAGVALLRQGDQIAARDMFRQALNCRFNLKSAITYVASYLPSSISRRLPGKLRFSCVQTVAAAMGLTSQLRLS